MKRSFAAKLYVSVIVASVGSADIGSAKCAGDLPQPHPVGSFNFDTNSYHEQYGRFHRFVSCVQNLDEKNDLRVNWYVPGPHKAWIPAGETLPSVRILDLPDEQYPVPVEGCLEFGNVGETTTAYYWNPSGERSDACEVARTRASKGEGDSLFETIRQYFRIFLPSDQEKPHDSMLEVNGSVGLYVYSGTGYTFQVEYSAERYNDRLLGDPRSVDVSISFPSDELAAIFEELYPDGLAQLSLEERIIKFDVFGPDQWFLDAAEIRFTDANGVLVGVQIIPVYVPG